MTDIFENNALLEYRYLYYSQDKNQLRNNRGKANNITVNLSCCIYKNDGKDSYPFIYTLSMNYLISYMNNYYSDIHKNWTVPKIIKWLDEYTSEESETIFCNSCQDNQVLKYEEV